MGALGMGPNPQPPIPNPQSPIPISKKLIIIIIIFNITIKYDNLIKKLYIKIIWEKKI
jgi:hypothetical protein